MIFVVSCDAQLIYFQNITFKNRNTDLIFSFPGGDSCRGFFIVSLFVEMAAGSGITVSAGCCYSSYFLFFMLTLSESQSDAVCPSVPLFLCPNHILCVSLSFVT